MEGTLEPGTRRAPSFRMRDIGKKSAPKGANAEVANRMLRNLTRKQAINKSLR